MGSNDAILKELALKSVLFIVMLIIGLSDSAGHAQFRRKKPKNSMAEGAMYVYWGYNRSAYTLSNIAFKGPGYNFTLFGVQAKDRPSLKLSEYFNPQTVTVPQFNFRIGYNFKNYWNLSLGYDHMKYVMVHGPSYGFSGFTEAGLNANEPLNGTYSSLQVTSEESTFHYENTNGLNYIRLELTRVRNIVRNRKDNFMLTLLGGISGGTVLSFNDFTFNGQKYQATPSISGLGLSMHGALRFEFFKHLFFQLNTGGGFLYQTHVKLMPNTFEAFARQKFFYGDVSAVIGALFYIRTVNDCNSCPHW